MANAGELWLDLGNKLNVPAMATTVDFHFDHLVWVRGASLEHVTSSGKALSEGSSGMGTPLA